MGGLRIDLPVRQGLPQSKRRGRLSIVPLLWLVLFSSSRLGHRPMPRHPNRVPAAWLGKGCPIPGKYLVNSNPALGQGVCWMGNHHLQIGNSWLRCC